MNDLEEDLARTLAATAAATDTHVERLLDHALTTGARYRHRHRMLAGTGVALTAGLGVALLVGTVSLGLPHSRHGGAAQAGTSGRPTAAVSASPTAGSPIVYSGVPVLQPAAGAPSLPQAPTQLGDPRYLHVSFAPGAVYGKLVEWGAYGDYERLAVSGGGSPGTGFELTVAANTHDLDPLTGTRSTVTVNGHTAQFAVDTSAAGTHAVLRWQPAPGLWAELVGGWSAAAAAQQLAEQVRFDQTFLCPTSLRVTNAPAQTTVSTCVVTVIDGVATGRVQLAIGSWHVLIETVDGTLAGQANTTLGGHPARVLETPGDGGHTILQVTVDYGDSHVVDLTAEGAYDKAAVEAIAGNIQLVTATDPANWPTNPLS